MITKLPSLLMRSLLMRLLGRAIGATFSATFVAVLMLSGTPAWSHGGEDHGDAPHADGAAMAALAAQQAPRASTQTDSFELVAVLEPGNNAHPATLTIYLDQVDTNAPVEGASIDVESGAFKAAAKPVAPGVYSVPAAALAQPGRHPLTFTVQSADTADLLDATLAVGVAGAPTAAHDHANTSSPDAPATALRALHALRMRWPWLAGAVLAAIALSWAWARRARARRSPDHPTDHAKQDTTGQA